MADYSISSSILSGNTANINNLITALEEDLPSKQGTQLNTTQATSSVGSMGVLDTLTLSLSADEVTSVSFACRISGGTAALVAAAQWFVNSTAYPPDIYWYTDDVDIVAERGFFTLPTFTIADLSGSIDFAVRWALHAGTGTIYADDMRFWYTIAKKRT